MAKTNANYSIKVGVDLDTSDIQKQLQEASKAATLKIDSKGLKEADADAGKLADSMGDVNEVAQENEATWNALNIIFTKTVQLFSDMIEQVYELDGALTEFKKVSDLSGESLDSYVSNLAELGKTTARTASEMVEAATTFRKNSFNDEDSARLATVATTFQNVSDTSITAAEAASFIISQLKAFGIEAEKAESIIDKVNETANRFSVGTNDLANGLELAGAAMGTYNNTIDQTIALVTAGSEILVGRSSQVARGLNTVAARLTSNEETLAQYGVALKEVDGSLRSTFEILSDLKPKWDEMSDADRVALGQTIAGQNQYKVLAAVMTNFATATDAVKVSLEADGSAARENARYMESLEA